jgi:hypothetical protein
MLLGIVVNHGVVFVWVTFRCSWESQVKQGVLLVWGCVCDCCCCVCVLMQGFRVSLGLVFRCCFVCLYKQVVWLCCVGVSMSLCLFV